MRKCDNCGYVRLSNLEKEVLSYLPGTIKDIAETIGRTIPHVSGVIASLKEAGLVAFYRNEDDKKVWKPTVNINDYLKIGNNEEN